MRDVQRDLELLVRSRCPLVVVHSFDELRIEDLIDRVARGLQMPLVIWSSSRGLRRSGALGQPVRDRNVLEALDSVRRMPRESIFYFKDLGAYLHEAEVVRRVMDLVGDFGTDRRTLLMPAPTEDLPPQLRGACAHFDLPLPSEEELKSLAWRVVKDFSSGLSVNVELTSEEFQQLIDSLKGLTHQEAERALCRAVADDLALTSADLQGVLDLKKEILRSEGVLEYVATNLGLESVGGLDGLKAWLAKRRRSFGRKAKEFGLPPPKGLILLGVQGCGKSMAAKAVAADWHLPLLRMEPGRLYDKWIGESDKNLERALQAAEHMAPCVLMFDEIEKGFAYAGSVDADGGLSRRIFGRLLGWLQDREAAVFVIATCNDVSQLPPELMRKGRFDEIFFIDLPDTEECMAIFRVHLSQRGRDPAGFDVRRLADAAEGFSGAEIEQVVVAGLYSAFAVESDITTEILLAEISATRPLSVVRAEDVAALRAWARARAVPAGKAGASGEGRDLR